MVTLATQHGSSPLPPRLQPRQVAREETEAERHKQRRESIRDAIHADLHVLYDRVIAPEFRGKMNKDIELSDAVYGAELAPPFVSHLEHYCFGMAEVSTTSKLGRAFVALSTERPHLYQVLELHLSADLTNEQIGEQVHLHRDTVARRLDMAYDVIAGKLGAWK